MLEIAFSSAASHFSQEHLLFGRPYILEFQWLERESYWVMHIYNGLENPQALGLKIMPNWPIYIDKISGIVFLLVEKTRNAQITRDSLHKDFMVVAHELI